MYVTSHRQPEGQTATGRPAVAQLPSGRSRWPQVVPGSHAHRVLLSTGPVGSVVFTSTFLIDGALRPGYGSLRQPMSALSLGAGGWVQVANFIVFGVLTCCSAVGWRVTLAPGVGATWYPRLKVLAGLALITAGVFSQDPGAGFPPGVAAPASASVPVQIHNTAAVLSMVATIAALFMLAGRLSRESRWRGWGVCAALTAVTMMTFLAAFGSPLEHAELGGIFEKLASIAASIFGIALTWRLLLQHGRLACAAPWTPGQQPTP